MENRKLKFLLEPITQEGISKNVRKSKFIFKLKNDPIPCDDGDMSNANINYSPNFTENNSSINHSNRIMEEKPSIILCKTNSIVDDEPFERKLDIEYPSVINIKKIEICSNPSQICNSIKTNKVSVLQKKHGTSKHTVILPSQSGGTNIPLKTISFKRIKLGEFTSDNNRTNSQKNTGDGNGKIKKDKSADQEKLPSAPNSILLKHGKKNLIKKNVEQKSSSAELKKSSSAQTPKNKILHITGNSPNKLENDIQRLVGERVKTEEIRLKAENEKLLQTMNELKVKLEKASEVRSYQRERLTLSKLKQNQEMLYYYIGFKDISLVSDMAKKLIDYFSEHKLPSSEILIEEQLIMTLMKLRRNYSLHDLAFRFRIDISEAYCIIFNIVHGLHYIYYEQGLSSQPFPSVDSMLPSLSEAVSKLS
ncbi:Leucine-rich repeats and immunoglobulin-like domains protein 3 [Armadillidium vulgare]|nr:Leucine-rich repeats and immunoglobulin-like domains protein 3 [Armadillidium vulgare]